LPCLSSVPGVSAAQPVTKTREQFRQQRHEFFSWQFFKGCPGITVISQACKEYHLVCLPIFLPERQYIGKRDANGQKKRKFNKFSKLGIRSRVGMTRCPRWKRSMSMQKKQFILPNVNKTKGASVFMGKTCKNHFE
jgi:hypothetical protein